MHTNVLCSDDQKGKYSNRSCQRVQILRSRVFFLFAYSMSRYPFFTNFRGARTLFQRLFRSVPRNQKKVVIKKMLKEMLNEKTPNKRKIIASRVGGNFSTYNSINAAVNTMTNEQIENILKILFPLPNSVEKNLSARRNGNYPNVKRMPTGNNVRRRTSGHYPNPLARLNRVLQKQENFSY